MGTELHFMKTEVIVTMYIKNLLIKIPTSHWTDSLERTNAVLLFEIICASKIHAGRNIKDCLLTF